MNRQELTQKIKSKMGEIIAEKGYVSAMDLLMRMDLLSQQDYEAWRRRQVPYLERVIKSNLGRISFIMKTFAGYAGECGLKPSWTAYQSWGKGAKIRLRFSKSGLEQIERAYATHFILSFKREAVQDFDKEKRLKSEIIMKELFVY